MRIVSSLLIVVMVIGCAEEVVEKPENLIPADKMTWILYDLALINAAKSTNPRILEENGIDAMRFVYEKYEVDSAQFVSSDIYYASRPADYETIYRRVETRLAELKEGLEEERRRISDSVRIEAEKRREAQAARKDSIE